MTVSNSQKLFVGILLLFLVSGGITPSFAASITLNKIVTNDDGGSSGVNDFGLTINGTAVNSGQTLNVTANTPFPINETGLAGYSFVDITGDAECPAILGGNVAGIALVDTVTCTITNDDISPTITLNKIVTNDDGGSSGVNDFGLTINGTAVTSGQTVTVTANTPFPINETGLAGYSFVDITGDAECPVILGGNVAGIALGDTVTCTITNDDLPPAMITLNKIVIIDDGGTAGANNFGLTINGTAVNSGQTLNVTANTPFPINETGLAGYSFVDITGDAECPVILGGNVAGIALGDTVTCTITNDDLPPAMITLNKIVITDDGGSSGVNDFGLSINGTAVNSGQTLNVTANTPFPINETGLAGYSFVDITGDAECPVILGGNVAGIALGDTVTCTITNDDLPPAMITLNKIVIIDDGGTAGANNFGLTINGTAVNSGQTLNVTANTPFPINETGLAGYSFVDITGDAECPVILGGNVAGIALGDTVTCTITNDDLPPAMITLNKIVITDDGGSSGVNDFGLSINGTAVNSGQTLNVTANTPFPINETGLAGYSFVDITGDAECPVILGGNVAGIALGDTVTCTITNDDLPPAMITLNKIVIIDDGGTAGANNFGLTINGTAVNSGQTLNVTANTPFPINETGLAGYSFVDITGDAECPVILGGNVAGIALGDTVTCTITNDDLPPAMITLNKIVITDDGGSSGVNDFGLSINGTAVNSGQTLNVTANTPFPINETGLAGYSFVDITGDAECPVILGGNVAGIALGDTVTCTITNDDLPPAMITLNKIVIIDDGGTAGANNFGLTINGTAVNSGQTLNVTANTPFPINETGLAGYSFVDITGDAECPVILGGNVAGIALGDTVTCTITNDDLPPAMITLNKIVITDDGGSSGVNDFGLSINGTAVNSGQTLNVTANTPFPINETGLAGYSFVDITGDAECPVILGGNVAGIALGDTVTCTITNDDLPPAMITLNKIVITDDGGTAGANNFGLTINGTAVNSGQTLNVTANTPFPINETGLAGYSFVDITGDAECPVILGGNVAGIALGDTVTCTITNDDLPPAMITLNKIVITDDGGSSGVNDFGLSINGTAVNSGQTLNVTANTPFQSNQ